MTPTRGVIATHGAIPALVLAIDTSGPTLSVGLIETGSSLRTLHEHVEEIGRGHAERLVPTIRDVLARGRVALSAMNCIAVVVGPGSFMGLRVGIAAARALSLASGKPAIGVSRLRALAHGRGGVHVVLDAKRGEVFEQVFDARNEPVSDMQATSIAAFRDRGLPLVGSGAGLVGREAASASDVPSLTAIAALARDHPLPPRPIYGRGADAKKQQVATFSPVAQR